MSLRIALLLLAATGPLPGTALAQTTAEASPRTAIDTATKLARWQLARMNDVSHISRAGGETRNPRAWEQAAFWVGMTALADHGAPADIGKAILETWGLPEELQHAGRRIGDVLPVGRIHAADGQQGVGHEGAQRLVDACVHVEAGRFGGGDFGEFVGGDLHGLLSLVDGRCAVERSLGTHPPGRSEESLKQTLRKP